MQAMWSTKPSVYLLALYGRGLPSPTLELRWPAWWPSGMGEQANVNKLKLNESTISVL